jgi:acyl-CoA synthetase (AMP-forming)/AMP-acid ligase II
LFLSTRLTAPAHARLLQLAHCSTLITTTSFEATVQEIQKEREIKSVPMLERSHYRHVSAPRFYRTCDPAIESRKIAWIVHSSGSTGFPKPIFLTNYACLANFCKTLARRAFCTSPLFHSHGLMELFRCIYSKNTFYIGNFSFPVTRQNLIGAMNAAKPKMLCAVPYVLKLLAESEEGIRALSQTELVLYAGSSCPDALGDMLEQRGVNVVANYGAYVYSISGLCNTDKLICTRTETGQIMTSFRPAGDHEWSWMRLKRPVADHVLMDEISPGIYECVALDGLPSKGPSNSDNPPNSFRTRDLFIRHPDPKKSNYWKYVSRLDDRITLVNGEKVLPIPVEGQIRQSDLVREVAVFGVGRVVPGLLVFRSHSAAKLSPKEYMDEIWPVIESANSTAETFGRIPRELVVVLPVEAEYPRTDKGTFIRAQLYEQYSGTIDDAYKAFEGGGVGNLKLDVPGLEAWLLQKFLDEFDISLDSVDSDIFSAGVDSLQTMRMWRLITKELDLGGRSTELSQNIVFEQGTVKLLANYLYALRTRDTAETTNDIKIMSEMIQKYSRFNRQAPKDPARTDRDCVVRTTTCQIHGTQTNTSSSLLLVPLEILAAIYWLTLSRKTMYRRFLLP